MAKKRHVKSIGHAVARVDTDFARFDLLAEREAWEQAGELSAELARRFPNRREAQVREAIAAHHLGEREREQEALRRILAIAPNDADAWAQLGGSYLSDASSAHAAEAFRRYLEVAPETHPHRESVPRVLTQVEAELKRETERLGLAGPDEKALTLQHEQVRMDLTAGRYSQARAKAEALLKRQPQFAPALNNISQAHFLEGRLPDAIQAGERVLTFDPENIHALANLTIYTFLSGREEEARRYAERLKASGADAADRCLKIEQALSHLGDDAGVLAAYAAIEPQVKARSDKSTESGEPNESGEPDDSLGNPATYHLAATAALRSGDEPRARALWKLALEQDEGFELAQANLADLRKPVGERHAPWPFAFVQWLGPGTMRSISEMLQRAAREQTRNENMPDLSAEILRRFPPLQAVIPALLDRGDPAGRRFALDVTIAAKPPELLTALRDFALGQHGPDEMRVRAASTVVEAGLLPGGETRLWLDGAWRELTLYSFEVSADETAPELPPPAQEWFQSFYDHTLAGEFEEAQADIERVLELHPDNPRVLFNLSRVHKMQGREKEASALVWRVHAEHPDYFFGRAGIAEELTEQGRYEEARAALAPLLQIRRLHPTEAEALFQVEIDLALAEGQKQAAENWLTMWEQLHPDAPGLPQAQRKVRGTASMFRRRGR